MDLSGLPLAANTQRGNRPGFSDNLKPAGARDFFNRLTHYVRRQYHQIQHGIFGAGMQVTLTNDGPVTFWLQV